MDSLRELLVGKRILIAGYGREGKSSHTLLRQYFPDEHYVIAQNNQEILAALESMTFDLILKSPGIPTFVFEGHCDLNTITSQTDLFLQVYGDRTVGVTGTKGKSTTTSLIYHTLRSVYGSRVVLAGNIGIPLFDIIDQIDESSIIVAELSCHQLENIHRGPHIAVLLNLFQEHLDHYHDYMGYKMAKMQIGLRQQPCDHFFYCTDNQELAELVKSCHFASQVHPYALAEAQQSKVATMRSQLQGGHNLSNIFVSHQVTKLLGINESDFAEALASFAGLPHRLECVGTYKGITFYNDSISTIPAACMAAVAALRNVDTLILGGFDRGIDYSLLAQYLDESPIRNLVFVGMAGRRIHSLMRQPQCHTVLIDDDYANIVEWCFAHTAPRHVCLLSPAAASYDGFRNFEERGNTFKQLVMHHAL